jgi:heme/copper-type cytochrome/quinol oxidase subunit 2|uniref:Uncharacterized protein n=1 Tax=uncultured microorganism TaxID=358574 RepID=A0A1L3KS73_9ZZZZ|nr:hypothetical protein [uncultured microorganism]
MNAIPILGLVMAAFIFGTIAMSLAATAVGMPTQITSQLFSYATFALLSVVIIVVGIAVWF